MRITISILQHSDGNTVISDQEEGVVELKIARAMTSAKMSIPIRVRDHASLGAERQSVFFLVIFFGVRHGNLMVLFTLHSVDNSPLFFFLVLEIPLPFLMHRTLLIAVH